MIFAVKQKSTIGWIKGEKRKDSLKYISSQNPISYLRSIALPIIHNQGLYNQLKKPEKERVEFKEKIT